MTDAMPTPTITPDEIKALCASATCVHDQRLKAIGFAIVDWGLCENRPTDAEMDDLRAAYGAIRTECIGTRRQPHLHNPACPRNA